VGIKQTPHNFNALKIYKSKQHLQVVFVVLRSILAVKRRGDNAGDDRKIVSVS
jgi:hypothetical protein